MQSPQGIIYAQGQPQVQANGYQAVPTNQPVQPQIHANGYQAVPTNQPGQTTVVVQQQPAAAPMFYTAPVLGVAVSSVYTAAAFDLLGAILLITASVLANGFEIGGYKVSDFTGDFYRWVALAFATAIFFIVTAAVTLCVAIFMQKPFVCKILSIASMCLHGFQIAMTAGTFLWTTVWTTDSDHNIYDCPEWTSYHTAATISEVTGVIWCGLCVYFVIMMNRLMRSISLDQNYQAHKDAPAVIV